MSGTIRIDAKQYRKMVADKSSVLNDRGRKQKQFIDSSLIAFVLQYDLSLKREFLFTTDRKWRFDWAIPSIKFAFEYEGIFSTKSRHTTGIGYSKDVEKYNNAALTGWKVIRLTALNYKDIESILKFIERQIFNNNYNDTSEISTHSGSKR